MIEEKFLLEQLRTGNKDSFSLFFKLYYRDLVLFAGSYIPNKEKCEDIVQNVFLKLWNEREHILIEVSLKSFLLKSVKNLCLDEIRHIHVVNKHEDHTYNNSYIDDEDTDNYILYSDLHSHLNDALKKLPDLYRQAFEMNRFDGLKYKEIAQKLSVSERTIEVRIGKAIGLLRQYLKEFLISIILFFTS